MSHSVKPPLSSTPKIMDPLYGTNWMSDTASTDRPCTTGDDRL